MLNYRYLYSEIDEHQIMEKFISYSTWLEWAWVQIPFPAMFAEYPELIKAYDALSSLFNYDMEALIAQ